MKRKIRNPPAVSMAVETGVQNAPTDQNSILAGDLSSSAGTGLAMKMFGF